MFLRRHTKGDLPGSLVLNRDERSAKGGPPWCKTETNRVTTGALLGAKPGRTECQGGTSLVQNRDERSAKGGPPWCKTGTNAVTKQAFRCLDDGEYTRPKTSWLTLNLTLPECFGRIENDPLGDIHYTDPTHYILQDL